MNMKQSLILTSLIAARCAFGASVAKFIEYVQTDGNGSNTGEYILLDYKPTANSVVEAEVTILAANQTHGIFCSRGNAADAGTFTLFYLKDSGLRWDYNRTTAEYQGLSANTKTTIRCAPDGFWLDGVKSSAISVSPQSYTPANKMMLFASYMCATTATPAATGNYAKMRLYSFKAWDDNGKKLRVDLHPCVDSDGKIALYDTVADKLYYNLKSGKSFTAGPDLVDATVVPVEVRTAVTGLQVYMFSVPGFSPTPDIVREYSADGQFTFSAPAGEFRASDICLARVTGGTLYEVEGGTATAVATTSSSTLIYTPTGAATLRMVWDVSSEFVAPDGPQRFTGPAGGDWHSDVNWSYRRVPIATDAVALENGVSVVCTGRVDIASLAITNASLAVKGPDYAHVAVSVAGNLDLGPGAKLTVTAGGAATPANLAAMYFEIEDLVSVGGTFHIADGGVFTPVTDILTGLPVKVVASCFRLDEGGLVDAANQGYGYLATPSSVPAGAYAENGGYTFAPGHGISYSKGAAYGATASHNSSKAYGFAYAPWLPGSPNGMYGKFSNTPNGNSLQSWGRGGGSAFIRVTGSMILRGLIDCRGCYRFYGSSSGGGIWLVAPDFRICKSAELCAEGGPNANNYGTGASGTGGRVSLGIGLTADQVSNLATGKPPASLDLAYANTLPFIRYSVLGGMSPPVTYYTTGTRGRQNAGTATWTLNEATAAQLTVTGDGAADAGGIDGVAFVRVGESLSIGVEEFKAAGDSRSHYIATSWSVTNAAGAVVASGTGGTATFTPTAGPLFLTWQISSIEDEIDLEIVGGGSVTANGTPVADGATFRAARGSALTLVPTPASGSSFILWRLGGKERHSLASDWAPTVTGPAALTAVFAPSSGTARTFSGTSGGYWEDSANWSPTGVPTATDAVAIGADTTVFATSQVYAASLEIAAGGILAVGGATANVAAQTPAAGSAGLCVAGNVALHGDLSIGGKGLKSSVPLEVLGNLALDGSARLAVYAAQASDFEFATLYREATVATVDGALTLAGSARVLPDADYVTGAPVRFRAGSVSVGADAAFDATCRGWGCTTMTGELPRFIRAFYLANSSGVPSISYTRSCSYAPGTGCDANGLLAAGYNAGHGGRADTGTGAIGCVYGNRYAPFLPGSNGKGTAAADRGGGTVWIECANHFMLDGALVADGGVSGTAWSSSGGGIWVVTRGFTASDTARASAKGGGSPGTASVYGSGGGRICIATGLTAAERDALAAGATPATLTYEDSISFLPADVSGGEGRALSATENYKGGDGTASFVRGEAGGVEVIVAGDPVPVVSEGVAYGSIAASIGQTISLAASQYGFDPESADVRYTCVGYLATNAQGGVVAQGAGRTATFTVADEKTYFTWLWGDRRVPLRVDIVGSGNVSFNSEAREGSYTEWGTATSTLVATPASGNEFLYWVGDVPAGHETDASITVAGGAKRGVTAVFRPAAAPAARTWLGGNGAWLDASQWQGGVLPGRHDDVTISAGNCLVTNYVEAGSVTVSGTGRLLAGTYQKTPASVETARTSLSSVMVPYLGTLIEEIRVIVHGALRLAESGEFGLGGQEQPYHVRLETGSFVLADSAKAMVTAGPIDATHTFATGCGFVNVAESFSVGGQSTLFLVCDGYTGGAVICRAGRFSVGPDAIVNANYYGFSFRLQKSPQTCAGTGRGNSYNSGPAHGGAGSNSDNRTYGIPYDYPYGPVMPGACVSPPYSGTVGNSTPGSGVIRVHARHVRIEGTLTAEQPHKVIDTATGYGLYNNSIYSSGAGGTIWITSSGLLRVQSGALVTARGQRTGQNANYLTYGGGAGGGRISLGRGLADDEVAALVANGSAIPARTTGKPIEVKNAAAFAEAYPGATVRVDPNGGGGAGTFWFLDGGAVEPTLLILR